MSFEEALEGSRRSCLAEAADDYEHIRRLIETAIASAFAVPVDELRAPSRRTQPVAFARQSAMYLAHVVLGLNYSATGTLFRRDRTTAAHACQVVEDRRDDPAFDHLLQQLEGVCLELAGRTQEPRQVWP